MRLLLASFKVPSIENFPIAEQFNELILVIFNEGRFSTNCRFDKFVKSSVGFVSTGINSGAPAILFSSSSSSNKVGIPISSPDSGLHPKEQVSPTDWFN